MRNNTRKVCNHRKAIIVTNALEKEELEGEEKENERKNTNTKEESVQKKVLQSPETTEDERDDETLDLSSRDKENWVTKEYPSGFEELQRTPTKNYFVLIEFRNTTNTVYYVAKVIEVLLRDSFFVTHLRNSLKMEGKYFSNIKECNEKRYKVLKTFNFIFCSEHITPSSSEQSKCLNMKRC